MATKTNRVIFACDPIFVKGFNAERAGREAAEALRSDDLETQRGLIRTLKAGLIAGILWPTIDLTKEVVDAAHKVLDTAGKARTPEEAKAYKAAGMRISRLMAQWNVPNLEPRGGDRTKPEKPEEKKPEDQSIKNLVATLTVPDLATPADLAKHLRNVAKGAASAVKKAEPLFAAVEADKLAAFRKAVKDFEKAVIALTK